MMTLMMTCPCCRQMIEARVNISVLGVDVAIAPEVVELEPMEVLPGSRGLFLYNGVEYVGLIDTVLAIRAKVNCSLLEAKAVFENRKRSK